MTYKQWGYDEMVSSSDLNEVVRQTIPRFEDAGARNSAITTPENNQYAYVEGVGLTRWNGATWQVDITDVTPTITTINFSQFFSTWTNYGSGYVAPRYYKDFSGIVHLEGLLKAGTSSDLNEYAVVLPSGYRPTANNVFPVICRQGGTDNKMGRVDIGTNGQVIIKGGGGNFRSSTGDWVSLSGIKFKAA